MKNMRLGWVGVILCNGIEKEPVSFETGSSGRGTRTRTQNKGFGDPRVTITPYPYALRATFDIIAARQGIVKHFFREILRHHVWFG